MTNQTQMLLLFRAGNFHHLAVPLALVARLEKVPSNTIQWAAGTAVLHYRGDILSLVSLASVLDPGCSHDTFAPEMLKVIVFTDGARRIGVVVDEIEDIVDEAITVRRGTSAPGLLGSAVIGGKITDLLDLHAIVGASGENWLDAARIEGKNQRILLFEKGLPAREMIADFLSASGYDVVSCGSVPDAMARMRQVPFDLVITTVEMGSAESADMLKVVRRDRHLQHLPVLGLLEHQEQINRTMPEGLSFDACLVRSDRGNLLPAVSSLIQARAVHGAALEEVA